MDLMPPLTPWWPALIVLGVLAVVGAGFASAAISELVVCLAARMYGSSPSERERWREEWRRHIEDCSPLERPIDAGSLLWQGVREATMRRRSIGLTPREWRKPVALLDIGTDVIVLHKHESLIFEIGEGAGRATAYLDPKTMSMVWRWNEDLPVVVGGSMRYEIYSSSPWRRTRAGMANKFSVTNLQVPGGRGARPMSV